MFKRFLILAGAVIFSLVLVSGMLELASGAAPAVRASLELQPGCIPVTTDITSTQTWTGTCYHVMTSTVAIQPGAILTISPAGASTGTMILFDPGARLYVYGSLQALGVPGRSITFTSAVSQTRCAWQGIGIDISSPDASNRIQGSTIEYACVGMSIGGARYVQILSNTIRYNGDGGSKDGGIGGITDWANIANNLIYSNSNGIALNKSFYNTISGNTIHDVDLYGILFVQEAATPGGGGNWIADNEIYNAVGGGVRLEAGSSNQVISNSIYLNANSAIYLLGQGLATVQYNHVYSNGGGVGYPAAIYITGTPNLAVNDISYNVIHDTYQDAIEYTVSNGNLGPWVKGNALCSVPTFELQNGSSANISAPSNWWSTNTPTSGREYTGPVNITPWITLSLITSTADLPADGISTGVITISLRDPAGNTVPRASTRQTNPSAPNARRVNLSTTKGVISPAVVYVGDDGFATATLTSAPMTGTAIISAMAFCNYPVSIPVRFAATNLAIAKTTAVTQVVPGGALAYRIAYSNTSGITANDVRITDTLPAGATWSGDTAGSLGWTRLATSPQVVYTRPSLPPGVQESFVLTVTVASGTCNYSLINQVALGTRTVEDTLVDNTASAGPTPVVCADVIISKTTALTQTVSGGLITYTITYGNQGSASAENTIITDTLPAGTRYVSSSLPCPACVLGATGPLTWWVDTLPPNSFYSFTLTLQVEPSTIDCNIVLPPNSVVITTTTPEADTSNNSAASPSVIGVCPVDLVVIKDDDVGPTMLHSSLTPDAQAAVERLVREGRRLDPQVVTQHRDFVYEGDLVTYTIAVVNVGTVTATNVVLTETLPQYTTFVTGSNWMAVTLITYTLQVGSLPPGDGRIYYFIVQVNDPITADVSSLINHVCGFGAEGDRNPVDNCGYEDTPVHRQPLRISKSAQCVIPGKDFSYWMIYTNTTMGTYSDVRITDTLPMSVTYTGVISDWNCPGNLYCTWIAPAVYPGTGVKELPIRLDRTYPYAAVTNTVAISESQPFTLVTPVDRQPDLAVVKNDNIGPLPLEQRQVWEHIQRLLYGGVRINRAQDGREYAQPGERITYTILYVNNGMTAATNVVLTETLPANTTYVGGGWTFAGGRFYTLSVGTLGPQQGGEFHFIVQVNDPFPCGANRVVNRVDIGGAESECDLSDNWSADHTPISGCTPIQVFLPLVLKQEQGVPPVQVAFSSANYQVWENSVVATITVVLNSPSSQVVTVDYATSDGTATAGRDYVAASGTLTFVPGQTSQIFTVRILTDTLSESPETVILTLSRPVNAELGQPNPATLTIVDLCSPTPPNCAPAVWCTFPSNFGPMGMAYDTVNSRLFVANQGDASNSGNLTIFTSAGVPIQALGGLSNAQGVALDNTRGRNRAYVAGGNWLYIVDASGVVPSVLATVDVGIGGDVGAHSVAYNPNTDLIYVTGYNDDSVTVVSGATWDVLRRMTGFHEPSYTVVNTVTNKVYVSNHTGGVPWGYVSVISGTSKIAPDVHLGGDLYGIAVDSVRNRIYVGSISAARVYVIDGRTDTTMGDIQIVRARDARPVPLRMTVVNPSVISDTHLWITSSQGDYWGMDRLILLDLPGSEWPPQTPRVLRATAVEASPEGGLLVDTVSWNVFASSAVSNLVTASHDSTTLCATPLSLNAEQEQLYTVVSNYRQRGSDR